MCANDKAGCLAETQETPTGKNCTTRVYSYDEESNRIGLTSREAGSSECTSEDGVVQAHSYDSANQLIDSGVEYETFGNATKLPAIDAGEHALTSTYYVDNQVASQKQNEETIRYLYDPAGRAMETVSEGKTGSTVISHYAGSGNSPTWTSEGSEKWMRNIPGIGGELAAIQTSGGATVLQLHDLQGNIVGTAALSEAETKLLSTYNSTEFGVPQPGTTPPKYAWLGAAGVWSEPSLSSGVSTQGGGSYVPQIARNLQTFPVIPPGSFPNGYGLGAPHTAVVSAASMASAEAESAKIVSEVDAERQKAKEEEAAAILQQCREEGGCGAEGGEEERYYDDQAQALAEEQEANDERGMDATSASFKLRLSVGCLEAGFWTYCSGQYHGKWYYNKVASNSPYEKSGLSTGVRVGAGVTGAVMVLGGGSAALACGLALTATPEDGQVELVPGWLHCMAVGAGALLTGGYAVYESIFG